MEVKAEYTAEERKAELVEYLESIAEDSLTAEGLANAIYTVRKFSPRDGGDLDLVSIALDVADSASEVIYKLLERARELDVQHMERLLDPSGEDGIELYNKDLVHDLQSLKFGPSSIIYTAAVDQICIDVCRSIEWRVDEIVKVLKKGNHNA